MNIEPSKKHRTVLKRRLTNTESAIFALENVNSSSDLARLNSLKQQAELIWREYYQLQSDIIKHISEDQMANEMYDLERIEAQYIRIQSRCKELQPSASSTSSSSIRSVKTVKSTHSNSNTSYTELVALSSSKSESMLGRFWNKITAKQTKPQSLDKQSTVPKHLSSACSMKTRCNHEDYGSIQMNQFLADIDDQLRSLKPVKPAQDIDLSLHGQHSTSQAPPVTVSQNLSRPAELPPVSTCIITSSPKTVPFAQQISSNMMPAAQSIQPSRSQTCTIPAPSLNADISALVQALSSNLAAHAVIPQMQPLKFTGHPSDWPAFRDLFQSLASRLHSDADRLLHLKLCCKGGTADQLVIFYDTTNEAYSLAWQALVTEYDQEKTTIMSQIRKFLHHKPVVEKSPTSLRDFYTNIDTVLRSLKALKYDQRDLWLITILLEKLDQSTSHAWGLHSSQLKSPSMDDFMKFMLNRCVALELSSSNNDKQKSFTKIKSHHTKASNNKNGSNSNTASKPNDICAKCQHSHRLHKCQQYQQMHPNQRYEFIRNKALCENCLRQHSLASCNSRFTCFECKQRHHSTLHAALNRTSSNPVSHIASINDTLSTGLLPTAYVNIQNDRGHVLTRRVLIDSGSNTSLITESLVQALQLKRRSSHLRIGGTGGVVTGTTRGSVTVKLISRFVKSKTFTIQANILKKVTSLLPQHPVDSSKWSHLNDLQLADPRYMEPDRVDMIIGVQHLVDILEPGLVKGPQGTADAINSIFGWLILGDTGTQDDVVSANTVISLHNQLQVDDLLRRFWEVEQVPSIPITTDEENAAEVHFQKCITRNSEGRFVVKLPFRSDRQPLGNSLRSAYAQAISEEKRRLNNSTYDSLFKEFMQDIDQRGHWERIPPDQISIPDEECYYMKRHGVLKESSTTTKLRVVVNASSPSSNGVSLNDNLLLGPKVQRDLLDIMLRFRIHRYVFTADIEKMYRMIVLDKSDANFQRILWRTTPNEPFQHYRLTTVIYGTRSAPYQATRALVQCAQLYKQDYPEAANVLLNDCYVDDITSGHDDINQCSKIMKDLSIMLSKCGFNLRKWTYNDARLKSTVTDCSQEQELLEIGSDIESQLKILGVWYDPSADEFRYKINIKPSQHSTRRILLSEMSRIYDPFGFIQPTMILSKMLLQEVWRLGTDWDDTLPDEIVQRWAQICQEFYLLEQIKIPRWLPNSNNFIELHGFSDASESSYCAVVYCRMVNSDGITSVNMIMSKTKVAPIRPMSIPRLELCAALLLAKLMEYIQASYFQLNCKVYAWTDSSIVLAWLTQDPRRWKTFVCQRVVAITDIIAPDCWRHVGTKENPADKGTRGLLPSELLISELWWKGPDWLCKSQEHWPSSKIVNTVGAMSEARKVKPQVHHSTQPLHTTILERILKKSSSYHKTVLIMAVIRRQIANFKLKDRTLCNKQPIQSDEFTFAELELFKSIQNEIFETEMKLLQQPSTTMKHNVLSKLHPFVDANGLLRVGGRLSNSRQATYDIKHPIILPGSHPAVQQLAEFLHRQHQHAGITLLSGILNQRFWIVGLRKLVKDTCFKCLRCYILKKRTTTQLMGTLPPCRVEQNPVFTHVGVDLAGPIIIRTHRIRKATELKAYIVLYICTVTKAVHLDIVESASTEDFLLSFQRFVDTRGRPTDMYSDNGTNFVGANGELQRRLKDLQHDKRFNTFLLQNRILWHFNTPRAPNQGGLWESNIKSVKQHLKAVTGEHKLTLNEMLTLLKSIEACLNSRPLCEKSRDPDCYDALTPGHFLIQRPLLSLPQRDYSQLKLNRLKVHELITRLTDDVWRKWRNDYLYTLQPRHKWNQIQENLKIGDLVVISDETTAPTIWPLGRIIEVYPDKQGFVRNVDVKTHSGIYRRSVVKLVKLPVTVEEHFKADASTGADNGCAHS